MFPGPHLLSLPAVRFTTKLETRMGYTTKPETRMQVLAGVARGLTAKRMVMRRRRARDLSRMLAGLQPVEALSPMRRALRGDDAWAALIQRSVRACLARRALREAYPRRREAAVHTLQRAARARQARSSCYRLRRAHTFTSMGGAGESLYTGGSGSAMAVVRAGMARRSLGRKGEGAAGAAAVVVQRGVRRLAARRAVSGLRMTQGAARAAGVLGRAWLAWKARGAVAGMRRMLGEERAVYAAASALGETGATMLQAAYRAHRARRAATARAEVRFSSKPQTLTSKP